MNGRVTESGTPLLTRREVMVGAAGLTFSLVGCQRSMIAQPPAGDSAAARQITPWVGIAEDGTVSIVSPAVEMGQGSRTSLPLILAEELDADWDRVEIVPAPPIDAVYGNPEFDGQMYTAGSAAVSGYFDSLRRFGAQVRRVLLDNVARHWSVPVGELSTEPHAVVHAATGRRIDYGAVAAFAEIPETAPEISEADLKDPSEFRLIGNDVMRVELPQKVDGTAQYSIDVHPPGMVYGAVLQTPVPGGTPDTVDASATMQLDGVLAVEALPHGVGVLAETPWAAFQGKAQLNVRWSNQDPAQSFNSERAMADFSAAARSRSPDGVTWENEGDVEAALDNAATLYEREFRSDFAYHAQMEPLNAVASVAPNGESCEIWVGTQSQTMAVNATAQALGIAPDRVRLNEMLLGGGFGRRGATDQAFLVDAVRLSQSIRRPVKVIWTREDDLRAGRFHPLSASFIRAGLDAGGRVTAWHTRRASDLVEKEQDPMGFAEGDGQDVISMEGSEIQTYAIPNRLAEHAPRTSGMRTLPLRGIGFVHNKFATESLIDEIAVDAGRDPVEFRLDLLADQPRARKVIETAAGMSGWGTAPEGHGLGIAYIDYEDTQVASVVDVSVLRQTGVITVHNVWLAIDCGIAVQPDNVIAQQMGCAVYGLGLALTESVSMDGGVVEQSNFHDYLIPRMSDIPNIEVELVRTPNPPTGAAQMATPLMAPAISNALAALTGVRLRHMPMTGRRVREALQAG